MKKIYQKPELTVIPMAEHSLMGISGEAFATQDFAKKNNSEDLFDYEDDSDDKSARPFSEYLWE